jgi:hypothetical protein
MGLGEGEYLDVRADYVRDVDEPVFTANKTVRAPKLGIVGDMAAFSVAVSDVSTTEKCFEAAALGRLVTC